MTPEEKTAFEDLQKSVKILTESIAKSAETQSAVMADIVEKQKKYDGAKSKGFGLGEEVDQDYINHLVKRAAGTSGRGLDIMVHNKTMDDNVLELQKKNDDILLVSQILGVKADQTKLYQDFIASNPYLSKAMDTQTSAEGLEWVPVGYSPRLFDKVRLELKVAALHEEMPMPTAVYKPPVVISDAVGYLVPEQTADDATLTAANRIPASTPGTGDFTLTAKKIAGRVIFSEELNEDSIVPVLPFVSNNIVTAISTAIETATINGDTAGTHQDADVTAATDARKSWDGYRKITESAAKKSIATFNGDTLSTVRKAMGKYGVMPSKLAWVTGISGYNQMLNLRDSAGGQLVTTLDKYGPGATILSGELGKLYGIPIIISEYVREDLNATGVYDGTTTTKTIVLLVNRTGMIYGDRRTLKIKTAEDINTDQTILVATTRKAFARIYAQSTDYVTGLGYNLAS